MCAYHGKVNIKQQQRRIYHKLSLWLINNKQRGFSLIEVLITAVLSSLIVSLLIETYIAQKQNYQQVLALARIQESALIATRVMTQQISQAGYAGCAKLKSMEVIQGDNDSIEVKSMDTQNIYDIENNMTNDNLIVSKVKTKFKPGNQGMISDCQTEELFIVNNVTNCMQGKYQCIYTKNKLHNHYLPTAVIARWRSYRFFVATTGRVNVKKLPINALFYLDNSGKQQELTTEINSMKISYAVAEPHTNKINSFITAAAVTQLNQWNKVIAVMIVLTLKDDKTGLTKTWPMIIPLQQRITTSNKVIF